MAVEEDVARIAAAAAAFASPGENLAGVLVCEPLDGRRVYLCAYESAAGHAWLALDDHGGPVEDRLLVRKAASLAALCEVAEESAGGGDLDDLRGRLAALREREAPTGIEEAEEAASALARTLELETRIACTPYLDAIGAAARRLERALGDGGRSPFAAAMQQAMPAVEELTAEVERRYKGRFT